MVTIKKFHVDSKIYFKYMNETTSRTEKFILRELDKLKKLNKEDYSLVAENLLKRIKTKRPKIRPGLVRLGYEICGGKNWKKIVPICAAIEILNVSTYTINKIFDEKGGGWDKKRINNNIIAGIKQRELAHYILHWATKLVSPKKFVDINKLFIKTNDITYSGQVIDLNDLNLRNKIPDFKEFMKKYTKRCHYFGGNFYRNALVIGGLLANGTQVQLDALWKSGYFLGTGIQMVNDIGDFVPEDQKPYEEAFKYYQDQFGDLRSGKLTLPIYLLIKNSSKEEKEFILSQVGKTKTTKNEGYKLAILLFKTDTFRGCKKITKKYIKDMKDQLILFENSKIKNLLSATPSIIKSSIYWKKLREIYESSLANEKIILVDEKDKSIGIGEKNEVHRKGKLHRAFSILVFNSKGELLIQKRAGTKYHSGGLWSNTVCSHPNPKESLIKTAHSRLKEEMGFDCPLKKVFSFRYKACFENSLIENEIDHVFIGEFNGEPKPNFREVADYKWISINKLGQYIKKDSIRFTPWFKIILDKIT